MVKSDFEILIHPGNIGFFQSCEVTQIFLQNKHDHSIINLFVLASIEEKPLATKADLFLTPKITPIDKDYNLGIMRYWRDIDFVMNTFTKLITENKWDDKLTLGKMKPLPKQFIPAKEGHRINSALKNNFHNGSYLIELFDETKVHLDFLLGPKKVKLLNELSNKIKEFVPIDLSVVSDRIGNIIFQFPITILDVHPSALKDWTGVKLKLNWHRKVTVYPDCLIQVESSIDKNYMGSAIVEYTKDPVQEIVIGNLDQTNHIKVWRKTPNLLLSTFDGSYIRHFNLNTSLINHEPRKFYIGKIVHEISVSSAAMRSGPDDNPTYTTYINNTLYNAEKAILERTLSFKQYFAGNSVQALEDIRSLIKSNDANGIYLWDPFLRAKDILQTLFFSPTANVQIRAIGAIDSTSKKIYKTKGATPKTIIAQQKTILDNPKHNNFGLNLEFRLQHGSKGYGFHDRFLIFPGSKTSRPKVYSLGTSINSIGQSHHIFQEVSHPQRVIDAFEELWTKLNHKDCLVWKSPAK